MNYHVYAVLIRDIKELLSQSNNTICHTPREENNYANFLVKFGVSSNSEFMIHASFPKGLFNILRSNTTETFFLLVVPVSFFFFVFCCLD
jgi:hypothetical protein